jgi:hypothetical protein
MTIEAGEPTLTVEQEPPRYGFEVRAVPGELMKRVHPERQRLVEELAQARALLAEGITPQDPWEAETWAAERELRALRCEARKRQLDRLPAFSYAYEWRQERVKIAYLQLKAALTQPLTVWLPGREKPEHLTITATRSYAAKLLPGADRHGPGHFPSSESLRAELTSMVKRQSLARLRSLLDQVLTAGIRRAVDLAGRGAIDQAVDLLCTISGTPINGLKAPREAEKLLCRTWSPRAVAYLLAPEARPRLAERNLLQDAEP